MFLPLNWSHFLLFWHSIWKSIFFVSLIWLIVSQTSSWFRGRVCGGWGGRGLRLVIYFGEMFFWDYFLPSASWWDVFFFFFLRGCVDVSSWWQTPLLASVTGAQINSSSKQTVCFQKGRLSCFCFSADFDEAKKTWCDKFSRVPALALPPVLMNSACLSYSLSGTDPFYCHFYYLTTSAHIFKCFPDSSHFFGWALWCCSGVKKKKKGLGPHHRALHPSVKRPRQPSSEEITLSL